MSTTPCEKCLTRKTRIAALARTGDSLEIVLGKLAENWLEDEERKYYLQRARDVREEWRKLRDENIRMGGSF